MGTLRKYLLNGAIISSVLSGVNAFRQQRKGPKDWRTYATWIAWAITLAVAVGTVRITSEEDDPRNPRKHVETALGPAIAKGKTKGKKKK